MLPTGHIAAGYLVGIGTAKLFLPEAPVSDLNVFGYWGAFFGFAPDLDVFYAFARQKNLLVAHPNTPIHRNYFLHAPLFWLLPGLALYFFGKGELVSLFGLVLWLASWSHLVLDSIEFGVMWLWPFSRKLYAILATDKKFRIEESNFFRHSLQFLLYYSKTPSFYFEVLIILAALTIYLK